WTGHPDLDEFDQWCYELDTWAEVNDVPDGFVVKTMMNYLGGKAAKFFMNHVAPERNKWSKQDVYDGLFDYCFPEDFKRVLRAKLERAYQGTTRLRDYVREIEHLAKRFPDVTDFQLVQIFWKGINQYLRVHLIEKGFDPETTPLDRLVKHAARKEKAH
ncbi:hypothetical protein DICSQDRAFT_38926, partial [Dichomitus squalens LYAD-421 SS1]